MIEYYRDSTTILAAPATDFVVGIYLHHDLCQLQTCEEIIANPARWAAPVAQRAMTLES